MSLSAAKFPGKPVQAVTGYPVTNTVFIDWNRSDKSWWFKWNQKLITASKIVWQVSSMPYTGGAEDLEAPLGLAANGVIDSGRKEFSIDFSKFVLSNTAIKKNFVTPAFLNTLKAAVSASSSDAKSAGQGGFLTLQNGLAQQLSRLQADKAGTKKKAMEQIIPAGQEGATLVPEAAMAARKNILETMGFSATLYKYYMRVPWIRTASLWAILPIPSRLCTEILSIMPILRGKTNLSMSRSQGILASKTSVSSIGPIPRTRL